MDSFYTTTSPSQWSHVKLRIESTWKCWIEFNIKTFLVDRANIEKIHIWSNFNQIIANQNFVCKMQLNLGYTSVKMWWPASFQTFKLDLSSVLRLPSTTIGDKPCNFLGFVWCIVEVLFNGLHIFIIIDPFFIRSNDCWVSSIGCCPIDGWDQGSLDCSWRRSS